MPFMAVAQALSRLARQGVIQRLGKGLYYRPRPTAFGASRPNSAQIRSLPVRRKGVFPAGIAAANLLGFTTQNPARVEVATNGPSLPRLIVGKETVIHTRRPESWQGLSETDAALLDFLRNRGESSELSAEGNGGQAARILPRTGALRAAAQGRPVGAAACPRHARGHRPAARSAGNPALGIAEEFESALPV